MQVLHTGNLLRELANNCNGGEVRQNRGEFLKNSTFSPFLFQHFTQMFLGSQFFVHKIFLGIVGIVEHRDERWRWESWECGAGWQKIQDQSEINGNFNGEKNGYCWLAASGRSYCRQEREVAGASVRPRRAGRAGVDLRVWMQLST